VTTDGPSAAACGSAIDLANEDALLARRDALEAFQLEALQLEATRRRSPEPADIVAAEARVEAARERFWVADRALRDIRRGSRTG
jgi:hypothetical protein